MHRFDVFLSYKSEDHAWVERLKSALIARGVTVWLDKDQIRPGDRFVTAIESGLETSNALALIVTPECLKSGWVLDEYSRALALSNDGTIRLIPLILRNAQLPGFLSNRQHVDFRNPATFEQDVDRLVWPGLTGKRVKWFPIYRSRGQDQWDRLFAAAKSLGLEFDFGNDVDRAKPHYFDKEANLRGTDRLVVVADIFDSRAKNTKDCRSPISQYIELIFDLRGKTKNTSAEIVFVLYHHGDAWSNVTEARSIDSETRSRLMHYFTLRTDLTSEALRESLLATWHGVQRELLQAERIAQ